MKTNTFLKQQWIIILVLFFISLPSLQAQQEITVPNYSFEIIEENMPQGWEATIWDKTQETPFMRTETGPAAEGHNYLVLENTVKNHAMATIPVTVEPGQTYLFSAMVKTENVGTEATGVQIGVFGFWSISRNITGTLNTWTEIKVNLAVGQGITEIKLMLHLGGYASLNTGRAYFDMVRLKKISQADPEYPVMELKLPEPENKEPAAAVEQTVKQKDPTALKAPNPAFWIVLILLIIVVSVQVILLILKKVKRDKK